MDASKARILIVDDEPIKRAVLEDELKDAGYIVQSAANPIEAEPCLEGARFDVVLTDLRMPGQDGLSFLRDIKRKRPDQTVIVMTAYGTVETAIDAMRLGAFDYVQKPVSTEELLLKLDRALRYQGLRRENAALKETVSIPTEETKIVGNSKAIREVMTRIHAVSSNDTSVLIIGESGTGKELAARVIHETSHRSSGPFIAVSCAALPRDLVAAELFGHEQGSFTGAVRQRVGRFELAHGGTIFLDDVDDIPIDFQVKLLRVLQERAFERIGGETQIRVNVRVIAATKKDLGEMISDGTFREDLYYRLNVVPLRIPPLRERLDDIPLLVDFFLQQAALRLNRDRMTISQEAISELQSRSWPGNVRQLEHLLEHVAAISPKNSFELSDLPPRRLSTDSNGPISISLDGLGQVDMPAIVSDVEARLIQWALDGSGGNLARAADMLGVPRSTLQYKVGKLGEGDGAPPA